MKLVLFLVVFTLLANIDSAQCSINDFFAWPTEWYQYMQSWMNSIFGPVVSTIDNGDGTIELDFGTSNPGCQSSSVLISERVRSSAEYFNITNNGDPASITVYDAYPNIVQILSVDDDGDVNLAQFTQNSYDLSIFNYCGKLTIVKPVNLQFWS